MVYTGLEFVYRFKSGNCAHVQAFMIHFKNERVSVSLE